MPQSGFVDGRAQRTQVVMLADTVYRAMFSVEEEAFVCDEFYSSDSETGRNAVNYIAVFLDTSDCGI